MQPASKNCVCGERERKQLAQTKKIVSKIDSEWLEWDLNSEGVEGRDVYWMDEVRPLRIKFRSITVADGVIRATRRVSSIEKYECIMIGIDLDEEAQSGYKMKHRKGIINDKRV